MSSQETPITNIEALENGQAPVVEPLDGVTLTFHGLTAGPMLIEAEVERDGGNYFGSYLITGLSEDGNTYVATPDSPRHTRVEEAIEECGGKVETNR